VIQKCVERGLPVFPGALSPTEIWEAWELGATMVKVFPAEMGGELFLRGLRGPFPKVKLMPTGGITLETLPGLIKAGANGFGIGSPLFQKARIEAKDWGWLEHEVAAYVQAYRESTASGGGTKAGIPGSTRRQ
jgi:2-dehydro-3-deoxyphosphogluconate aldolase / (4S)-4-hydroxy-2-oxoglutarate aldolase